MEWRDIGGYTGLYKVSDRGDIFSIRAGRIMSPSKCNGYLHVSLRKDGVVLNKLIHRLVAEAFIPNPYALLEINHKDEDRANNVVDNLEWCTRSYNLKYGTAQQRRVAKISKSVKACCYDGACLMEFPDVGTAARATGASQCGILNCCKGKQVTAAGLRWEYA